jgi:CSLREA domain-containing protein
VVNTTADDATGTASNCTSSPEGVCTLRDALAAANILTNDEITNSKISFDSTVFLATNSAAANTITLSNGVLRIPWTATISGLTSGGGATLTNLVTVSGDNATPVFAVGEFGSAVIANLNITNGQASEGLNGGGVSNGGTLTVTGCTFKGNSAQSGGAIYSEPAFPVPLTVINSTFSGNAASSGGAIYIVGTQNIVYLTVTGSTFSGNSASAGGAIFFDSYATGSVQNSSFSGNSAEKGGGIYVENEVLNIANSILEGNTVDAGGVSPDIYANYAPNDLGGNLLNMSNDFMNPNLSPLGNYGGPTQTMLPEPGSAAICGGIAANIPAGVTADQRGYSIKNTTYPGYSSSTPCVDSGSVQTHYALAFTTQPPANATYEEAIDPAPVVTLTESRNLAGTATGTVTMTDSADLLSGTTSEGLSSGTATFTNLVPSSTTADDIFTASFGLNPMLNISAQAFEKVTITAPAPVPATMLSPTPGTATILGSSNILFQWSRGAYVTSYELLIGTSGVGSSNILATAPLTTTSYTVPALPADGVTLYVRLGSLINGAWQTEDYQYTEGTPTPATMLLPTPGINTILGTSNIPFQWSTGVGITSYELLIGTSGVGSSNILNTGVLDTTSYTLPSLPGNGDALYVRLGSLINGAWQLEDYQYTESGITAPAMQSPTPGTATILGTSNVTFIWTPGTGDTAYDLYVGTTGVGSSNVYQSGHITTTSATVPSVPYGVATADTVYVRLWYEVNNGTWLWIDYTYSASQPLAPVLTNPTPGPGTVLGTSNVIFNWTAGTGPIAYDLYVGTTGVGSSNVYHSGHITTTSTTVPIVPYGVITDTVYVRLWYEVNNGTWLWTDYTYSATQPVAPVLTTPAPGTLLGTSDVIFEWTAGTGPIAYDLYVGTVGVGSSNLYQSGHITATSTTVPTLPAKGATVYARLWYEVNNGTWLSTDYTYTEQ